MPKPATIIPFPARPGVPSCAQCQTSMSLCCIDDAKAAAVSVLTYRCDECGLLDTVLEPQPAQASAPLVSLAAAIRQR